MGAEVVTEGGILTVRGVGRGFKGTGFDVMFKIASEGSIVKVSIGKIKRGGGC